jgi:hypothetical protein
MPKRIVVRVKQVNIWKTLAECLNLGSETGDLNMGNWGWCLGLLLGVTKAPIFFSPLGQRMKTG